MPFNLLPSAPNASILRLRLGNQSFFFHSLRHHACDRLSEGQVSRRRGWRLIAVSDGPKDQSILNDPGEAARVFVSHFAKKFLQVSGDPD